jgi:hypothetical protein
VNDDNRSSALDDPFTAQPIVRPDAANTSDAEPIPIMLAGQALLSLRDSGYTIAAALGEVIDNSIEANANHVRLLLREVTNRGKRKAVDRIVVVDDGDGMDDSVLHRYLQLGFSTRYGSTTTIGKFGVGAKLAALNFGKRVDVWTRPRGSADIRHVFFDLATALELERSGQPVVIAAPDGDALPEGLSEVFPAGSGTLVMWSDIDRLADGTGAHAPGNLRQEIEKELARIFREFICGGITISVNDNVLLAHDPTFVREGTWADRVLSAEADAARQPSTKPHLRHFPPRVFFDGAISVAGSKVRVIVTLAPREVLRRRGMGGDEFAKKLRVPENQGQISFMRLGREISYANVPSSFGSAVDDPDRFIGIEVHFTPELDSMMGVRNVKRGAEPSADFREALRILLKQWIPEARKEIQEWWGTAARNAGESSGEHDQINKALAEANLTLPKSRVAVEATEKETVEALEDLAVDVGKDTPEEKKAYVKKVKQYPFVIESVDFPGTNLFEIMHTNKQTIIRLNTRHRFYREMYAPLTALAREGAVARSSDPSAVARRAVEAVTLLLVAYAKAESMDEQPNETYGELRQWWGSFTDKLMSKIKDVLD